MCKKVGRGTGYGALHELPGLLQLNNSLSVLDLTNCSLNGYESKGSTSISKPVLRLAEVLEKQRYSDAFTNLRIASNPLLPKKGIKLLRDATIPPLVIDYLEPIKGKK